MVADVRLIRSHDTATRPADAFSHAPPVLRLVARTEPVQSERTAKSPAARPWRGIGISAAIHAALIGILLWQMPGGEPAAPMSVEVVFWSESSVATKAASGDVEAAAGEATAAEQPPEIIEPPPETEVVADAPQPEPVSKPLETLAAAPEESPPLPVPAPVAEVLPEPVVEPVAEIAAELPPSPRPRPASVRTEKIEPPPAPAVTAAPQPEAKPAAAPAAVPAPPAETRIEVAAAQAAVAAVPHATGEIPVIHEPRFRAPPAPARYPARALDLNQQGTVVIRALVGPDGASDEVVVWRSSGYSLLDAAAVRAVRNWAFEPASVAGRRIASWVEVPVRFAIR